MQLYFMQYIIICQHLFCFSKRFPYGAAYLEIYWKSSRKALLLALFSTRFPKTVLFMEQIWKSSQKHFPHIEKSPFVTLNHNGAPIFVLFFFRRNYFLFFSFSSPAFPDGTNIPWRSGCSCLRRRTSLSSCPVSCSR